MRMLCLPALLLGMSSFVIAQSSIEPCCTVVSIDTKTNLVTARDKTTGKLYQFKADKLDITAISKNDEIEVRGGMITSIGGAKRTYSNVKPAYGSPCCFVVEVKPDPIAPCCGIVTFKSGNDLYQFQAPKSITGTLKIGDPVYAEPAGAEPAGAEPAGNPIGMAIIYAKSGNELSAHGFPLQVNDVAPCCQVVMTDAASNRILARDNKTGRLYQFTADALDAKSIKVNDEIAVSSGMITRIGNANRSYASFKINYAEPCCTVVSIQPDPGAPCCNIVIANDPKTNAPFAFKVPKEITSQMKMGDPVYAEPAGQPIQSASATNWQRVPKGVAVVYANTSEGMQAHGYTIESASGGEASSNSNEFWKVTPNNLKGVNGRLVFKNLPRDGLWQIDIYREPDNTSVYTIYHTSTMMNDYALSPGKYTIHLSWSPIEHVPIESRHDTELKYGILNVVSEGTWMIYHNNKSMTTRYKPTKMILPPGEYRLNLGGKDYNVIIKEGETVEY